MVARAPIRLAPLLLGVLALGAQPVAPPASRGPEPSPAPAPIVVAVEIDAIIHPVSAEYLVAALDRADAIGASLLVVTLRTPGGLVDSTRTMISKMIASKTPVAVYVAPSGARAASAGFLLTIAADVAAMAPGTHIGAAHPVSGDGQKMDETSSKKAASDVAAYARSLASKRHRNVELAELAVTESRSFTEDEALEGKLIDLVATDLPELLARLNGRTISRFDGQTVTLQTASAAVTTIPMTLRQQILSAIAHPQIAYLLFTLGTLGLTIELWNPGSVLPGVVGGLCLLLAFFAFQVLPINYVGLLLMLFGVLLLALEVKVTSWGLLAAGGTLSLVLGSMMLVDSSLPELQIGLPYILPLAFAMSGILVFLARIAYRAQRLRPITGDAGMIGQPATAMTPLGPRQSGRVFTHGEIWNATADEPIDTGEIVRVAGVEGLTLRVARAAPVGPGAGAVGQVPYGGSVAAS